MSFSLNEIDALCRKAARGAGHDWGHAEDAGKAARWLEARGVNGAECLVNCLEGGSAAPGVIKTSGAAWHADGGLSPIVAGAGLATHAATLAKRAIVLHDVHYPGLLIPFAAIIETQTRRAVSLAWSGFALVAATGATSAQLKKAMAIDHAATVTCTLTDTPTAPEPQALGRATLSAGTYAQLDALARRTYAPATASSRAAGAGAGLTDND